MHILNVGLNYRIIGGSDRYMMELGELLEQKGHKVIPFAARHPDNVPSKWNAYFPRRNNSERPGLRDIASHIYSSAARRQIDRLLEHERIDLAHLHIYYGQLTSSILGVLERRGIPIVQTLHEYKLVCPVSTMLRDGHVCHDCRGSQFFNCALHRCNRGRLTRSLLSTVESYVSLWTGCWRAVSRFICVSDFQRGLIQDMGIPADRLITVHNFVAPQCYRPAEGAGEYVLYFGRIERMKGVFTLLNAAAELPKIPFIIAGDGNDAGNLCSALEAQKLANVRFVGFQRGEALNTLIAGCRFSILPTEWPETFGLTVLETFMKGRPVIGSRLGGIQEIIEDGVDGRLFQAGDVMDLSASIAELWNRPNDCRALGAAGQIKARTRFDPNSHYLKLINIYKQVL